MRFPFLVPNLAKLSQCTAALETIERSNQYSNFGPTNTQFENDLILGLFGNVGACTTVANATLGLMLAIKKATQARKNARYVIMPSFTFAAAANAVDWCGLIPLLVDIDSSTWAMDHEAVESVFKRFEKDVALVFPYATFGNNIDLDWYQKFSSRTGVPVVVDAAASLGSFTSPDAHFGKGSNLVIVYSMHATKAFPTAEGGLIYSCDKNAIRDFRMMSNFGFDENRNSVMPGMNAKLSEIGALLGKEKLKNFPTARTHRQSLYKKYRDLLSGVTFQSINGEIPAAQMMPVLLPDGLAFSRDEIIEEFKLSGLEARKYFAPCIHEHTYFSGLVKISPDGLRNTENVSARILNLPIYESLTISDVEAISGIANAVLNLARIGRSA